MTDRPLHVALYCHHRLPVKGYGGTERVVVWLARGLAELGHRVTLLAPRGSVVREAALKPVESADVARAGGVARLVPEGVDMLHLHAPVPAGEGLPHVYTQHGNAKPGKTLPPTTIYLSADHARRHGSSVFVYNGIDLADFDYRTDKEDYDLFLGRLHRSKGYDWAIEGARRAERPLVIAGGWRPSLRKSLRYVGEVDDSGKRKWLAGARCVWMPAQWEEPFGLTLVEALASGTPVLGTRRGSLPEIITPEVGALGDTLEELIALREGIDRIDPAACRARCETHFSHRVMAAAYVVMYRRMLHHGML